MSETALAALSLPLPDQGERKFLLDAETAGEIWSLASKRLRPHHRDASRPITYHRTTYFDTADHAYYRGAGPVACRVRVREYATAATPDEAPVLTGPCFLELKQSSGGTRTKTRIELESAELDAQLEGLGATGVTPCLATWYQRAALADSGKHIRVTLDSSLRFCSPQPIGAPCCAEPSAFARMELLVLEVKAWGALPPWLRALVSSLHEFVEFSKFRSGMRASETRLAAEARRAS